MRDQITILIRDNGKVIKGREDLAFVSQQAPVFHSKKRALKKIHFADTALNTFGEHVHIIKGFRQINTACIFSGTNQLTEDCVGPELCHHARKSGLTAAVAKIPNLHRFASKEGSEQVQEKL
jgi:hypothetical protein